jgi:O-antigen ligase
VIVAALPWLQPLHGEPWTAFYSEALAAAAMLAIGAWAVLANRGRWPVDAVTGALLALAAVPLVQASFGLFVFVGEAWLVTLYLLGFATTVLVARRAQQVAPWRLADALWAAIAIASLLSAGLTLYQWLQQDWLGAFVHFPLVGGRAYANLGQPNNLATLLCWGLIAVWWAQVRGRVGRSAGTLAAAFLLLGVVLTRSRTGWLEVGLLAIAALHLRRRHHSGPSVLVVLALLAWFVLLAVGLDPLVQHLSGDVPAGLRDQVSAGKRPLIWQLAVAEVAQRPWFGHGWNQGVPAHMDVAERFPDLLIIIQHAHSLVLDLLVWNGIPLGLTIVVGLAWWARGQWRSCSTAPQRLLLLALAVLLVHALLELPHAYLFFLLPAAIMMGTLGALSPSGSLLTLHRGMVGALVVALSVALAAIVHDYGRIEDDLMAARIRAAHIHNPHPPAPAHPLVLGFLHAALERLRTEPTRELSNDELAQMRHTIVRYPSLGGLFRYAQASALRGQRDEARWALERLCWLNSRRDCAVALQDWRAIAAQGNPEMDAVVLPAPR